MKKTILLFLPVLIILQGCMSIHEKNSALMSGISNGDVKTVSKMLRKGANINVQYGGDTPLVRAIRKENDEIVELLLEKGADTEIKENHGETALTLAIKEEKDHIKPDQFGGKC